MMFGIWQRRRNGIRGISTMAMVSLVGIIFGLAALLAGAFMVPTQMVTTGPQAPGIAPVAPVVTPLTNDVGLIVAAIVIGATIFIAIGVAMGMRLRKSDSTEADKAKNDDVVEKKKKRLAEPQYAHTSDGAALEVVDDDGDKSLTI